MVEIISVDDALQMDAHTIDTRSEIEFEEDHIPGAVNIPILDTEERHVIGKLYKKDPEAAIKKGFAVYGNKLDHLKDEINKLDKRKPAIVYCFRGRMRSEYFSKLVESCGFDTKRIEGGYKQYRRFINSFFANYKPKYKFVILYGLAGAGKTDVVRKLENSIDLEGLAKHRGSLFGAVGLKPTSQKMFESLLCHELRSFKGKFLFLEGESQKIGDKFVPNSVFDCMQSGIKINITSSMERRVKRIVRDYFTHNEDDKIKEIILKLKPVIGNELAYDLIARIDKKEYDYVAQSLLENYYDDKYNRQIEAFKFDLEVENDDTKTPADEIMKKYSN